MAPLSVHFCPLRGSNRSGNCGRSASAGAWLASRRCFLILLVRNDLRASRTITDVVNITTPAPGTTGHGGGAPAGAPTGTTA